MPPKSYYALWYALPSGHATVKESYGAPFVKIFYLTDSEQKLLFLRIFNNLCAHLATSARI